ncbi:MAG: HD-GYP domain-containing protein [Planctomycetaceae bacterium]
MSSVLKDAPGANPAEARTVDVQVDELIIGRAISCPVYGSDGLLLIAAGCTITSEIKRNLKARNILNLAVSEADAEIVTLGKVATEPTAALTLDTELTTKIDQIIDAGTLEVRNRGPAAKESVVFLGRKAYDLKQRARLVESHAENGRALAQMIQSALRGETIDGVGLSNMTALYFDELTRDTESTLTSAVGCIPDDDHLARSLEVSLLSMAIGVESGLDADNVRDLGICALVNDWGMMRVPKEVRNATRRLTSIELLEIKKHPIYSLEMLQKVSSLPRIASIVAYQVHESPNGKGYPRGRCGNSIHPFARIIHVADAYLALTKLRPYRPPFMRYSAMENLLLMARDRSVDPDVVRTLLRTQSLFPIGSLVALSDGSVARVMRRNHENYTQPFVQRIQDRTGRLITPSPGAVLIDLAEAGLSVTQALPNPGSNEIPLDKSAGLLPSPSAGRSEQRSRQ